MRTYDRVVRSGVYASDRFLELPTDTHRLIYLGILSIADDFGNLEAAPTALWRWAHMFSQVKSCENMLEIASRLCDIDLLRRYEAPDGKAYFHIPRFQCDRRYISRRVPGSPWDDLTLEKRAAAIKTYRKTRISDLKGESSQSAADLLQGCSTGAAEVPLGVGVGVGVKELKPSSASAARLRLPAGFSEFWGAYPKKRDKQDALKAYAKLAPEPELQATILAAISAQKAWADWTKSGGQFIPHAATWLNGRRWEDEAAAGPKYGLESNRQDDGFVC